MMKNRIVIGATIAIPMITFVFINAVKNMGGMAFKEHAAYHMKKRHENRKVE